MRLEEGSASVEERRPPLEGVRILGLQPGASGTASARQRKGEAS